MKQKVSRIESTLRKKVGGGCVAKRNLGIWKSGKQISISKFLIENKEERPGEKPNQGRSTNEFPQFKQTR